MNNYITKLILSEPELQILKEALAEFINSRSIPSVEAYVARRYADHPQGDEWRKKKVLEVKARIQKAGEIRTRLFETIE